MTEPQPIVQLSATDITAAYEKAKENIAALAENGHAGALGKLQTLHLQLLNSFRQKPNTTCTIEEVFSVMQRFCIESLHKHDPEKKLVLEEMLKALALKKQFDIYTTKNPPSQQR